MNFKLTMVLVIVLCLLGSLVLLIPGKKGPEVPGDGSTLLVNPAPREIKTIEYWHSGSEQVAFAKTTDGWEMTYPVKAKADEYTVGSLAGFLLTEGYKEKIEPGNTQMLTPDVAGTEKPKYVVKYTDDAGKTHTLGLGKRTVSGIYATLDGGPTIYLLDANHNPLDQLEKEPGEFRNKTMASAEGENKSIVGLVVKHADQTVRLSKVNGKWEIEAPFPARANAAVVDEMANEMKSIKATGFADMGKDLAGLTTPVLTVTAEVEETTKGAATQSSQPSVKKSEQTLELGYYQDPTSKQNVYASLAGSADVFTVSGDVFKKLDKELKDLRDPAVTPVDVTAATQVSIAPAQYNVETSVTVQKEGNNWIMPNFINHHKAGNAEVLKLLTDIRDLRAIQFVDGAGDLKSIGLDPPQTTISITLPGKKDPEVLLIGKPETADKVTPMMRKGEPTVYLLQSGDIEKMLPTATGLRDKTVDALVGDNIRSFTITGQESKSNRVTLERKGNMWDLKKGDKTTPADELAITSLMGNFTPLMAQKYLVPNAEMSGKGPLVATVEVQGVVGVGPTTQTLTEDRGTPAPVVPEIMYTHTLRLYRSAEGKWAAVWDGAKEPWVFEPTAELVHQVLEGTYEPPATQPAATNPALATMPAP